MPNNQVPTLIWILAIVAIVLIVLLLTHNL